MQEEVVTIDDKFLVCVDEMNDCGAATSELWDELEKAALQAISPDAILEFVADEETETLLYEK